MEVSGTGLQLIPVEAGDSDDLRWALETANTLWAQGDRVGALKWLSRGAEAASDAGNDIRSIELAKAAADLRTKLDIATSQPPSVIVEQSDLAPSPQAWGGGRNGPSATTQPELGVAGSGAMRGPSESGISDENAPSDPARTTRRDLRPSGHPAPANHQTPTNHQSGAAVPAQSPAQPALAMDGSAAAMPDQGAASGQPAPMAVAPEAEVPAAQIESPPPVAAAAEPPAAAVSPAASETALAPAPPVPPVAEQLQLAPGTSADKTPLFVPKRTKGLAEVQAAPAGPAEGAGMLTQATETPAAAMRSTKARATAQPSAAASKPPRSAQPQSKAPRSQLAPGASVHPHVAVRVAVLGDAQEDGSFVVRPLLDGELAPQGSKIAILVALTPDSDPRPDH